MQYLNSVLAPSNSVIADLTIGYPQAHVADSFWHWAISFFWHKFVFVRENAPGNSTKSRRNLSALDSFNLNNKLMNFSNNLAVETLLLEKACDLCAQLSEQPLVIWTSEV